MKSHPFSIFPGELWLIIFENSEMDKDLYRSLINVHSVFRHSDVLRAFSETKRGYYNNNGQLMYEGNYVDGEEQGVSKRWCDNGQLGYESNWVDGKKQGSSKWGHENGQLRYEFNYVDGELIN